MRKKGWSVFFGLVGQGRREEEGANNKERGRLVLDPKKKIVR